jgi:metal-sulfur cluster biosynthetic enzyme
VERGVIVTQDAVRAAVNRVADPCARIAGTQIGLVDMGLLRSIEIAGARVRLTLAVTGPACMYAPMFLSAAREAVLALPSVTHCEAALDTSYGWTPADMSEAARGRLASRPKLTRQPNAAT